MFINPPMLLRGTLISLSLVALTALLSSSIFYSFGSRRGPAVRVLQIIKGKKIICRVW